MLGIMLRRARALGAAALVVDERPVVRKLSLDFDRQLEALDRDYLNAAARHWHHAGALRLTDAADLARLWPDAVLSDPRSSALPAEVHSAPGVIDPSVAIEIQRHCDCEVSADLVYDTREDRVASFVTRGCRGGVMSNLIFYFWFSSRYLVLPLFHTHPGIRNDLGLRMPSPADYWLMSALRTRLGGGPVGERVCFPDGSYTEYGVTGAGQYYFRRPGQGAQLFPALAPELGA